LYDLGWEIFWFDGDVVRKASSLRQIVEVKRDPFVGYNFVACPPESFWSERMRSLLR
jgi:hypothetical protein